MKKTDYFSAKFENDEFIFLDQTKLPLEEVYVRTDDYERIALAIERLEVRGAPLIGIAAAYALALSLKKSRNENNDAIFNKAYDRLARTRPTAVNLFSALDLIKSVYEVSKEFGKYLSKFFSLKQFKFIMKISNIAEKSGRMD